MSVTSARLIACASALAAVSLVGVALRAAGRQASGGQGAPATAPPKAEQAFKNIRALTGISVDDFMGTMGLMSAALGFDCQECHDAAGTDKVDWAADTPRKVTARRMVAMVTAINRDNFGGRQIVTCWT